MTKAHGNTKSPGSGYAFGGKRAEAMKARLRALKADPEAARRLMNGNRPADYAEPYRKDD